MSEPLQELILLDETELFEMLGRATGPRNFGLNDMQAYVRLGRAWFQQRSEQLRDRICSHEAVRGFVEGGDEFSAVTEAAAVVDALAGTLGEETAYVFAVLVTKLGLTSYCSASP